VWYTAKYFFLTGKGRQQRSNARKKNTISHKSKQTHVSRRWRHRAVVHQPARRRRPGCRRGVADEGVPPARARCSKQAGVPSTMAPALRALAARQRQQWCQPTIESKMKSASATRWLTCDVILIKNLRLRKKFKKKKSERKRKKS